MKNMLSTCFAPLARAYRKVSGGSLLLSIGLHAVILVIGFYLVVSQIVDERKISFGGGDTGPKAEIQHKVKHKASPIAPDSIKRITTTSRIANVALPDMPGAQMKIGPTISGSMDSGGFTMAPGLRGAEGGGKSSPTAAGGGFSKAMFFGLRGIKSNDGLTGTFYDLKQTPNGKPTNMALVPGEEGSKMVPSNPGNGVYCAFIQDFCKHWNKSKLNHFYQAKEKVVAYQIAIPGVTADAGPAAFGVEKECAPRRWIVIYEATILPPRDGRFRFRGRGDDVIVVRCNGQMVLDGCLFHAYQEANSINDPDPKNLNAGIWLNMKKGTPIKLEVLIGECPGGGFMAQLSIEEDGVQYPDGYPVFQVKEVPVPPNSYRPIAKNPIVFRIQPANSGYGSLLP